MREQWDPSVGAHDEPESDEPQINTLLFGVSTFCEFKLGDGCLGIA